MKKFLVSAGLACLLTLATSAVQIASSKDLRATADAQPAPAKCAVYEGDPGVRQHTPEEVVGRRCETVWANDTAEDELEAAQVLRVAQSVARAQSSPAKR